MVLTKSGRAVIASSFIKNQQIHLAWGEELSAPAGQAEHEDVSSTGSINYVMNNTYFRNGFGDVVGAIDALLDVIDPSSDLAKKLADYKSEIENTLIEIPEDESNSALARENFQRIAADIDAAKQDVAAEVP
jgi:hypothetical protein